MTENMYGIAADKPVSKIKIWLMQMSDRNEPLCCYWNGNKTEYQRYQDLQTKLVEDNLQVHSIK